jgi:hypothetical protein
MHLEPAHWILFALIAGWAVIMLAGMWQANQKETYRHRERLAMIEKGLPLPPEPPASTTTLQTLIGARQNEDPGERERKSLEAIRFLGIMTIGAGIGIWFLLVVLDQWKGAVAVGGMMVIIGVALILTTMRALRIRRQDQT